MRYLVNNYQRAGSVADEGLSGILVVESEEGTKQSPGADCIWI